MKTAEEWFKLLMFSSREERMALFENEDRSLGQLMEAGNPDWLLLPFIRAIQQDVHPVWLPIESAPKDGKAILACVAGGATPLVVFWNKKAWDDGDYRSNITWLTHWQPLPAPPRQP